MLVPCTWGTRLLMREMVAFIRNCSDYVYCWWTSFSRVGKPCVTKVEAPALTTCDDICGFHHIVFRSVGQQGCNAWFMDLVGLALRRRLEFLYRWRFVWCDTFLLCSMKWYVQRCFSARGPPHFLNKAPLSHSFQEYHQSIILNNSSSTTVRAAKAEDVSIYRR